MLQYPFSCSKDNSNACSDFPVFLLLGACSGSNLQFFYLNPHPFFLCFLVARKLNFLVPCKIECNMVLLINLTIQLVSVCIFCKRMKNSNWGATKGYFMFIFGNHPHHDMTMKHLHLPSFNSSYLLAHVFSAGQMDLSTSLYKCSYQRFVHGENLTFLVLKFCLKFKI